MVEVANAFKIVVDDFVNSAETEDQLGLFVAIATAAWNVSLRSDKERADLIQIFIDRFNCPEFTWKGKVIQTREKILELCDRKAKMYPEYKHMIKNIEVESAEDGLRYSVVSELLE